MNSEYQEVQNTPNNEPKKKNSNMIFLVIMALIIVGLVGYIVYDKELLNTKTEEKEKGNDEVDEKEENGEEKEKVEEKKNEKKDENSLVTINPSDKIVEDAMDTLEQINAGCSSLRYSSEILFSSNKYELNLPKYELIVTALSRIRKEGKSIPGCDSDDTTAITINEMNAALKKVILNPVSITIDDIKSLPWDQHERRYSTTYFYFVIENDTLKVSTTCDGCGPGPGDQTYKKIVKAEKNNDYLYVYKKVAFSEWSEGPKNDYYKDSDRKTNILESLESGQEPNWNLYNSYKYTFKIVDGKYYFQSIELIK